MKSTYSSFSLAAPSSYADEGAPVALGVTDAPETESYYIPLVTRTAADTVLIPFDKSVDSTKTSGFDSLLSDYFPSNVFNLTVHATHQIYDVVHVFGTDDEGYDTVQNETITKIIHLSTTGVEIKDNTIVTVSGMVRFPGDRTSGYVCGLPKAIISAYIKSCTTNNVCSYEEATNYTADDLGYFEISVTPGDSVLFAASYDGHDICYAGTDFDDECTPSTLDASLSLASSDTITTNNYVELDTIVGGETIIFFDPTQRTIDVGLYAGACGTSYEGYTMLITPANGCGSAISVPDTDIVGQWALVDPTTETSNDRYWPYAAMDYYIQLEVSPDVSALTETVILADEGNSAATCTAPGSNMLTFFRDRDELVRTLGFLNTEYATATYQ